MQLGNAQAGQATINTIPSMTDLVPVQAAEFRQLSLKGGSHPLKGFLALEEYVANH